MTEDALDIEVSYGIETQAAPEEADFQTWVACALNHVEAAGALGIRVVDAVEGRELNARYRQKDYATNVLSFPAELPEDIPLKLLGDLVLCEPIIACEAKEQSKAVQDHWAHLVVHGVLHLCGYDHEEDAAARQMESLERRILAELDISDPYAV